MADMFKGNDDVNGEAYDVCDDQEGDRRPFKALLDVGIQRTTTGARVFGVMKGASDGGLNVPHKTKRFPGYTKGKKVEVTGKKGKVTETKQEEATFDAKVHRDRIFGGHVTSYMNKLKKEDAGAFKRQFSQWEKCLAANKAKTCEDIYKKVHKAINANPDRKKRAGNAKPTRKVVTPGKAMVQQDSKGRKWIRHFRITTEMRNANVAAKFQTAMNKAKN